MIRHIVLVSWNDGVTPAQIEQVSEGFERLATMVANVRGMFHGSDLKLMEGTYDYAMIADFDSVEDWQAYRDHPEHLAFAQSFVPWAKAAARVQMEVESP